MYGDGDTHSNKTSAKSRREKRKVCIVGSRGAAVVVKNTDEGCYFRPPKCQIIASGQIHDGIAAIIAVMDTTSDDV